MRRWFLKFVKDLLMKRNHQSKFLLNSIKLLLTDSESSFSNPENAACETEKIVLKAGEDMKLYTGENSRGAKRELTNGREKSCIGILMRLSGQYLDLFLVFIEGRKFFFVFLYKILAKKFGNHFRMHKKY